MSVFKPGDIVTLFSSSRTLRTFGGAGGDINPLIGQSFTVRQVIGDRQGILLHDDPIHYTWHSGDFELKGAKTERTIPKPPPKPGPDPRWIKNIKGNLYPSKDGRAHVDFIIYNPSKEEEKEVPNWNILKTREGVYVNKNNACFAALCQTTFNDLKKIKNMDRDNLWISVRLSYPHHRLNPVEWCKLLKKSNVLPKAAAFIKNDRHFTTQFPISNIGKTNLFAILCFLRSAHEQPCVVPCTLNMVKGHKINFFVAYVISHALIPKCPTNHTIFYFGDFNSDFRRSPINILKMALKLEKYLFEVATEEASFKSRITNPGTYSFNLNNTIAMQHVEVPRIKSFNTLKGMKLNYS